MKVTMINEHRIRVMLSGEEMDVLGITDEDLVCADEESRHLFLLLLSQIRLVSRYSGFEDPLFIQAVREDEGCSIYYTRLHQPPRQPEEVYESTVFCFDSFPQLLCACSTLFSACGHRLYQSSLYRIKRHYFLIIRPMDQKHSACLALLEEYTCPCGRGDIFTAYISEHSSLILAENAVDQLARLA